MGYQIEVDFETWREITSRRSSEAVTECDVVKAALGIGAETLQAGQAVQVERKFWRSEGVDFPVGSKLEHRFNDGRTVFAEVSASGLVVNGKVFNGLSPAGVEVTKHQVNGWLFWYARNKNGTLIRADRLRGADAKGL